eukprot:s5700_g3.t1
MATQDRMDLTLTYQFILLLLNICFRLLARQHMLVQLGRACHHVLPTSCGPHRDAWRRLDAGKTTLGRGVAEILGFDFDDLDEVITRAADGKLPPQIVAEQGWDAFRKLEADCFQSAASVPARKGKILACGGGIIETARAMDIMRCHTPVILIDRHIDDVVATLEPLVQVLESEHFLLSLTIALFCTFR